MDHLIEWCWTHEAECKKLFSDSMQDAREEGRSKQQLHHGKNQIYIEMAKAIFLHDETEEFQSLAGMNPDRFLSLLKNHSLKTKYQKQNALLGQTGAGRTYEDLLSNDRTKNILAAIMKDFLWWADLHAWWHTNPAYNNTFSAANVGQDFAVHAVELFKLQLTPPAMDPETHLANLTVPCSSTLSGLEDGEIEDNEVHSPLMTVTQSLQHPSRPGSVKCHHLDLNYWKAQAKVTTGQEECKFQLLAQCEKHAHKPAMGAQEVKKMELAVQLEQLRAQNLMLQRGIAGGEDQGISGDQDVHPSPPSV
ncbi:hypothetical protein F5141DRAFT_1063469 [Pisolithus sp. B1]|nr:hypothetical protein F5141DRAFT_1063469 [Pisolithus sp. B1]